MYQDGLLKVIQGVTTLMKCYAKHLTGDIIYYMEEPCTRNQETHLATLITPLIEA